jgi:hypothetical protein
MQIVFFAIPFAIGCPFAFEAKSQALLSIHRARSTVSLEVQFEHALEPRTFRLQRLTVVAVPGHVPMTI